MKLILRKKKAFSMVELLLLLLFVSLITAALTPVITKKHYKMPKPANHGAYLCYDKGNGKLHEVRYSGKALTTVVFDRDVTQCTFEPPQKVSYFHVSAIGGGGGGGDSGYNGGSFTTMGPYTEQLNPLNITEYMVSPQQRDITSNDFKNYGGKLYGFVVGANSGKGGDQLYATRSDSYPCTIHHTETYTTTYTTVHTSSTCTKWTEVTVEDSSDSGSDSSGSSGSHSGGSDSDWDSTSPEGSHTPDPTPSNPTAPDPPKHEVVSTDNGHWGNAHDNGSVTDTGSRQEPGQSGLNGGINIWIPGGNTHGGETYNIKDKKLRLDLPQFRFFNPNNEIAMLYPKYAFLFSSNDLLAYTYNRCDHYDYDEWTTTESQVNVNTICDEHRNYYTYGTSTYTGAPGAAGAICRSTIRQGGVGLTYNAVSIPASGSDGKSCYPSDYWLTPEYDNGHAEFQCTGNCATAGNTAGQPYSTITFAGETVNAENARTGGAPATCQGNGSPAGVAGTSCSPAKVTEGCYTGRYGYCLKRWNSSTWEANTTYEFKFTYSQNYLQYGLAGEQGQYKTMVIRSFKDKEVPITIGLGGSKGVDGGAGGNGQATSFGNIMTANGGEGGEGGKLTAPEWLEGYRGGAESWPAGAINADFVEGKRVVRQEGGVEPEKPKPNNLSSNILNFLAPQDNEKITEIMDTYRIGYGGKGGGSKHNCWFGEYRKWLDGGELEHSYALPPEACRNNYERIEAENGKSGAVIIRW